MSKEARLFMSPSLWTRSMFLDFRILPRVFLLIETLEMLTS